MSMPRIQQDRPKSDERVCLLAIPVWTDLRAPFPSRQRQDVVAEVGAGVTSMEEKAAAVEQSHRPSTFRSFMTVFRGRDSEIDAEQLKLSEPVLDCDALMRKLHIKPMSVHQNKYLQPDEQNDGEVV